MEDIKKNLQSKLGDGVKHWGEKVLTVCDMTSPEAQELERKIKTARNWREYRYYINELHKKFKKRQVTIKNKVVDSGLNIIAQRLANTNTYSLNITDCALGDGSGSAAAGNTTLNNELYRQAISSSNSSGSDAFVSTFWGQNDFNDTINEVGHFIDGDGSTSGSGEMWSHIMDNDAADLPVTKDNTESLTVDYKASNSAT